MPIYIGLYQNRTRQNNAEMLCCKPTYVNNVLHEEFDTNSDFF